MSFNPVIVIPGLGMSKIDMVDEKGERIKSAWPFELDEKALLNELKGSIMKLMLFRKDGGFSDKIADIVNDVTEPLSSNPDGSAKHNLKVLALNKPWGEFTDGEKKYASKSFPLKELAEKAGAENVFFFAYNFAGDISETAKELDAFVSLVKEKTGCEKVNFLVLSTGGTVLKAYLKDFKANNDIDRVVNVGAALDGAYIAADIFSGKLDLHNPGELLKSLGGKAASLASMTGMLPGDVTENIISKSLNAIKTNLLNTNTSMWALIPRERFDEIYESGVHGSNEALCGKIKEYSEYSEKFTEDVKGMKFYQLCGWGKQTVPVSASRDMNSDGLINISSSSLGASDCKYDETPNTENCLFPMTTWFFKNQSHTAFAFNDIAVKLAVKILAGEIENVNSDPNFPQFNYGRNIKNLKTKLIPKAEKAAESCSEDIKGELKGCIDEYEKILSETAVENDDNVKALESRIETLLGEAGQ